MFNAPFKARVKYHKQNDDGKYDKYKLVTDL